MKHNKQYLIYIYNFFKELELNFKFLILLGLIAFSILSISIFDKSLNATGNLVTIRTCFSSIIGCILDKSISYCNPDNKALKNKTLVVGLFSIITMIVIIFSYILNISVDNPSLILFKNLLFSSVGFLTSSSSESKK